MLDIEAKVMIRPVATRWNSLLPVVSRALDLHAPLESLCKAQANTALAKFYPSAAEWELLTQLKPLLEVCFSYGFIFFHLRSFITN